MASQGGGSADATNSNDVDILGLSAEIVAAYVGQNTVAQAAIPDLIRTVHEALATLRIAGIRVVILGIVVPLINGSIGAALGSAAGMSVGGVAVMATLAASASYIAAPAAIRIALPDASPGIYVTASLGITFPFNLIVGIPLYIEIAELIA